jgi:signal transduction histidine kinase
MRKSISVTFFSIVATLFVLGVAVMGCSELVLFGRYFAAERYETLDEVAEVAESTAGYLMRSGHELGTEQRDRVELIGQSANVQIFFTDESGALLLTSSPELNAAAVPQSVLQAVTTHTAGEVGGSYHSYGKLDGALAESCFVSARRISASAEGKPGTAGGYLFVCSSGGALREIMGQLTSNFLLSACLMLLCACVMTMILMRRVTEPLHKISEAAQKFGGGDFSVRIEDVKGDDEIAALATTFNTMAANLQEIDNSRGQFMGNIAHELRTPMTTIKGFVDGILDGTIPPELQNHYLQIVSQEAGRLARLVQNMLDLSKLESGEYRVNARMFNIWETITGAALSAEQRITDGQIELEGLDPDNKCLVFADPDLIHQVVYNLLDNAIKFTPAGGVIRFSVEKLGPEAEITIWNSGQGISPEALPFVFDRFYKEDASRGLHARGAGLGLHICKVLVKLAGGQIRVESEQGEWCRFVFTLPVQPPNAAALPRLPNEAGKSGAEEPANIRPVQ